MTDQKSNFSGSSKVHQNHWNFHDVSTCIVLPLLGSKVKVNYAVES